MRLWTHEQMREFHWALDKLDFKGLDRRHIEDNALANIVDVPESEQVAVAIATVEMYIDQGVEILD